MLEELHQQLVKKENQPSAWAAPGKPATRQPARQSALQQGKIPVSCMGGKPKQLGRRREFPTIPAPDMFAAPHDRQGARPASRQSGASEYAFQQEPSTGGRGRDMFAGLDDISSGKPNEAP